MIVTTEKWNLRNMLEKSSPVMHTIYGQKWLLHKYCPSEQKVRNRCEIRGPCSGNYEYTIFWDMAQFTVVGTYQHFGGNYFLHFQGR
jgi:hypothetical protein